MAGLGRDDDRLGAFAAEAVAQDGKLVERLGADVAGLAAEKERDHTARRHHVDLVGNAAVAQHIVPAHHGAADDIVENAGVETGLVGVKFQNAPYIPQPCSGVEVAEAEGHPLAGNDRERANEVKPFKRAQRLFVGGVSRPALPLHGVAARNVKGRDLPVFRGRHPLNIGNDIRPFPPKAQEAVEKQVKIRKIAGQYVVVHPPGEQRSARHEEKVLDGIQKVAAQIVRKGRTGNVVKPVLFSGIGKGGHALFRREHPCREQGRIAAAGDVDGAVREPFPDS